MRFKTEFFSCEQFFTLCEELILSGREVPAKTLSLTLLCRTGEKIRKKPLWVEIRSSLTNGHSGQKPLDLGKLI